MDRRRTVLRVRIAVCLAPLGAAALAAQPPSSHDPAAPVTLALTAAEAALRENELQIAESRYRTALFHAWMLSGALETAAGRLPAARDAFAKAAASTVEPREAFQSLALIHLKLGEAGAAVDVLTSIVGSDSRDLYTRRLLAQALVADGRPDEAVQDLEEAHAADPDDLEIAFLLASGYLRLKKTDKSAGLFERIASARPLPQTYVLIGRTYRDAGEFDRARAALRTALARDPRVRRAHYYLGTIAVLEEGAVQLDLAIDEFRQELKNAPGDPVTSLRLGMALVEAQQPADALPWLETAAADKSAPADAFHYLGRCLLALEKPAEAADAFRKALELTRGNRADELRLLGLHYLLATALRSLGKDDEAQAHFAAAERTSEKRASSSRDRLTRYLADAPEAADGNASPAAFMDSRQLGPSPLSRLDPTRREALGRRLQESMARAYLNLGIMQARGGRFTRAAELFENASLIAPEFPQVQYSLGVAYFNAGLYAKAAAPLERAYAVNTSDDTVRRMLALTWLNTEVYDKAAGLLAPDAAAGSDPSLQYAYGLALVRSNRAAQAEAVFGRLLAEHGDTAELNVVLGQAHAQQGDYESAITSLKRALAIKPNVADANAALGVIYLRQGRLADAEAALRAELTSRPADARARQTLATVLDLQGQQDEALIQVRTVLKDNPASADARYLLGKIQLARGAVEEAVETLEAATRLAPDEPNIHYQLGQAYQKLGRIDAARREFETFQRLKDKRAGRER